MGVKVNPYHTLAHLNLGQIYWYEFQNKEKALKHLKMALALDPFLPNRKGIQCNSTLECGSLESMLDFRIKADILDFRKAVE